MKKLFVSFTGLVYQLQDGRITDDDMATGLFIFGCTRGHAINPGAAGEHVESVVRSHPQCHARIVEALLKAESEGRVLWRTIDHHTDFDMVNELLTSNGFNPLVSHEEAFGHRDAMPHYNYPSVMSRCKTHQVVF